MRVSEKSTPVGYRKGIWLVHSGREYLQAMFDRPKALKRALNALRRNKSRVYVTDDPSNP